MYDFEVNPEILTTTLKFELPIYKRIDKITKCFFHLPRCKRFPIKLYGETFLSFLATDVLELAFYIIIHNAIKYSKSYSEIKIEFEEQIDPLNINNILTVRFTNYGFIPSENDQEHLFERGYRGENSLGIKGSGIGLYNLKRICNASGVDVSIKVEPELERPKEGSFSIILRFEDCHRKK